MRAFLLSSPADEIAIWFEGGEGPLARFTSAPSLVGEPPRFDIVEDGRKFQARVVESSKMSMKVELPYLDATKSLDKILMFCNANTTCSF